MRPDADLILAPDPDGMPWGPRTPQDIAARALLCARAAAKFQPDVIVMACNTGSVHALEPLRAEFEPGIPVIGTVPAIKPAAAAHHRVAIWATVATTASAYQRRLIAEFAGTADVTAVACPALADAVDAGDEEATNAAIAAAAAKTPPGCEAIVLGCTEYELTAERISRAVPGAVTMGSAIAVAAQALRRVPASTTEFAAASPLPDFLVPPADQSGPLRLGKVRVLLSGRPAALPPAALRYPEGRLLAPMVVPDDVADVTRPTHRSRPSRVSPPPAAGAVIGG